MENKICFNEVHKKDCEATEPKFERSQNNISIEIVLALENQQHLHRLNVPTQSTLQQALAISKILDNFPLTKTLKFGIWGKLADENTILHNGDRIEIYRPLIADPKIIRRKKASKFVYLQNSDI